MSTYPAVIHWSFCHPDSWRSSDFTAERGELSRSGGSFAKLVGKSTVTLNGRLAQAAFLRSVVAQNANQLLRSKWRTSTLGLDDYHRNRSDTAR